MFVVGDAGAGVEGVTVVIGVLFWVMRGHPQEALHYYNWRISVACKRPMSKRNGINSLADLCHKTVKQEPVTDHCPSPKLYVMSS